MEVGSIHADKARLYKNQIYFLLVESKLLEWLLT